MIQIMKLEKESYTASHTHNFFEMVYVVSGSAEHHLGNQHGVLKAGDFFVVDYHTSHSYTSTDGDLEIINCLFLPEFIHKSLKSAVSFNKLAEQYFFGISGRKINGPASNQIFEGSFFLGELFSQMLKEYTEKKDGYKEILRFLLCQIIIETVRHIGSSQNYSMSTDAIIQRINEDYSSRLSLSDIASKLHYSLPYLSLKFKEETGRSFSEFLTERRIEESMRLLKETDMHIGDVAETVGYNSIKFFGKKFKEITGVSPREYRKI